VALYTVVIKTAIYSLYPMKHGKKSNDRPSLLDEQEEIQKKIGAHIRRLREKTGLSQEKFANQFDLDRRQISRVENGTNIEINTLVSFIRALDISLKDFFASID
jgi:ribosome-binding protein aMBF1 (putative translation factor)